jgi:hypothetical protein
VEEDISKYAKVIIDYFIGPLEEDQRKWMQEDLVNLQIGLTCSRGMRKETLVTVLYFMDAFGNKKENRLVYGRLCTYIVVIYDIIGSGIKVMIKLVDRNEDLIDKIGDAGGIIAGVGKDTFNLIKEIVNKDDNPWDYIKTGLNVVKDLKLEKPPGLKGILGLGIGISIADLTVGAVAGAKNLIDDPDTNFVDWTKYCVDKVFDVLNMVPGLGINSVLGTGMDFFLDGMSVIWNINKENAQIKADNEVHTKYVDYTNMVNRTMRE